ncbi:MAG: sulfurtransferase-like selenium metabolism protein YedF [Synergistaceae bacterium]|nr:sulfurtransferase-like selenium metabolism protein YedF [Synergistaceae bacterium]
MKKIDARGKACPEPVILTKACLDRGEREIEVLLDNPVSASNVRRFLENKGFAVHLKDDDGVITISASSKNGPVGAASPNAEEMDLLRRPSNIQAPAQSRKQEKQRQEELKELKSEETFSVLITCQNLGRNDPQLGEILMKSFLGTLSQLDDAPLAVALMNEGVKLALYDSSSCDHLKNLEKKGTLVLVCGTCVGHFQIAEQIGTGTISNMFEIVENLNKASKIITL